MIEIERVDNVPGDESEAVAAANCPLCAHPVRVVGRTTMHYEPICDADELMRRVSSLENAFISQVYWLNRIDRRLKLIAGISNNPELAATYLDDVRDVVKIALDEISKW